MSVIHIGLNASIPAAASISNHMASAGLPIRSATNDIIDITPARITATPAPAKNTYKTTHNIPKYIAFLFPQIRHPTAIIHPDTTVTLYPEAATTCNSPAFLNALYPSPLIISPPPSRIPDARPPSSPEIHLVSLDCISTLIVLSQYIHPLSLSNTLKSLDINPKLSSGFPITPGISLPTISTLSPYSRRGVCPTFASTLILSILRLTT